MFCRLARDRQIREISSTLKSFAFLSFFSKRLIRACYVVGASRYNDADLAKLPVLLVFGDHLDMPQPYSVSWQPFFEDRKTLVKRMRDAGGSATLLHPPELGIRGNSHMLMMDRNNHQIFGLIVRWIDRSVR